MILGCLWAEFTLYILWKHCVDNPLAMVLASLPLLPFLFYGFARTAKPGMFRRICNLIGAALLSADCYFMIISAGIGLLLPIPGILSYAKYLLIADISLCALAVFVGMIYARHVRVTRYTVHLKGAKSCKIAFFSDLHLGDFCSLGHLTNIVNKMQNESPDLVLYGGDLVDMDLPKEKKLQKYIKQLSKLGTVIACQGNHDLNDDNNERLAPFLKKAGIVMLLDEGITDENTKMKIVGRKSIKKERQSAAALCQNRYDILLDHDPKGVKEALCENCPLILCGHTHKGQTFPGNIIRGLITPYFYGKYEENGKTVITTSGCGATGLPLRLFVTNEIVVISIISD